MQKTRKVAVDIVRNGQQSGDVGAEIYRRFLDGDENALAELVGLYRKSLTQYINGFVNDMYEAEELALVAFAELAVDKKFEARALLKTYLFGIGRRLALRRVKNRDYTQHIPIEDVISILCGDDGIPETHLQNSERREWLRAAIETLKPEYREVLHLLYFENMTYLEAGIAMKKNTTQIANLAHRAKASLKKNSSARGLTYEKRQGNRTGGVEAGRNNPQAKSEQVAENPRRMPHGRMSRAGRGPVFRPPCCGYKCQSAGGNL